MSQTQTHFKPKFVLNGSFHSFTDFSSSNYHILLTIWWFRRFSKTLKNFGKYQFLQVRYNCIRVKYFFRFIPFSSWVHHAEVTCSKITLKIRFLTQWARILWFLPFLTNLHIFSMNWVVIRKCCKTNSHAKTNPFAFLLLLSIVRLPD